MLFFPIINLQCDNQFDDLTVPEHRLTEAQLRACAAGVITANPSLSATIDGVPVTNLQSYRAISPVFSYDYPAAGLPTIFGCAVRCAGGGSLAGTLANTGVFPGAVGDGIYLMLAPLSTGKHTIRFTAAIPPGFSLDVTYNITVGR
jgi:hypothetical protein